MSVSVAFAAKIQKVAGIIKGFLQESGGLDFRFPSGTKDAMRRRNGGRLCLGFQWDAGSWETVPSWCEPLFAWLDTRTVHWNLPAMPPDMPLRKRTSLSRLLRSRIEARGDAVTALGFTGACHPLLNIDELEREVAWGLKNPWGTGIAELLGVRASVLVPQVPDLARAEAWGIYRDHGFTRIGVCVDAATVSEEAPEGCLPCARLSGANWVPGGAQSRRLRRLFSAAGAIFLMVDLSGVSPERALPHLLEDLGAQLFSRGREPDLLEPAAPPLPPAPVPPSGLRMDWTPFHPPVLHAALDATAAVARRKRRKNEEYAALLARLGTGKAKPDEVAPGRESTEGNKLLVAHMLGEVALAGSSFDVRLVGGRFCGATRQGRDLMPACPAASFLRAGKSLARFKTLSSFSFESERGTGLREELGLDGRDGSLISIEYAFRDDSPLLSIAATVHFPDIPGPQVDEYAPLALALRLLHKGESATIEVAAPDGSASSVEVTEEAGGMLIPGAVHRIRRADGGWIRLQFATQEGRRWGLPSFRVTRTKAGRILEANPFGSYSPVPGPCLSGRREAFCLHIGLEDA